MVFASIVILGSFHGTHDHISVSDGSRNIQTDSLPSRANKSLNYVMFLIVTVSSGNRVGITAETLFIRIFSPSKRMLRQPFGIGH
jgi:hypothetical protein